MARLESSPFRRMKRSNLVRRGTRLVAFGVIAILILETSSVAGAQQGPAPLPPGIPAQTPQAQNTQSSAPPHEATIQDARNESSDSLPSAPTPMPAQQTPPQQPTTPQQPAQQQTTPQQPVGTAAAPYEKPTGVAGSRPAGAAIAPAKQRRVRALVIRVGIVLAAGAAVGAVVGLSKATHSSPQ
jgi:cytoskeletal protein RodZ